MLASLVIFIFKGKEMYSISEYVKFMGNIIKKTRLTILIIVLINIFFSLMTPLRVLILQNIIDDILDKIIIDQQVAILIPWILGFLLCIVLIKVKPVVLNILDNRLLINLRNYLLPNLIEKLTNLEYRHFENSSSKDIINRIGNSPEDNVKGAVNNLVYILSSIITLISMVWVIATGGWWIWLLSTAILIPHCMISIKNNNELNQLYYGETEDRRRFNYITGLMTSKNSLRDIRLLSTKKFIVNKWRDIGNQFINNKSEVLEKMIKRSKILAYITLLFNATIIISFSISFIMGYISLGQLVVYIGSIDTIINIVSYQIPDQIAEFNTYKIFIQYINDFFVMTENRFSDETQTYSLDKTKKISIEFKNVSFAYPGTNRKVITNLNLIIKPDEKIVIVGDNGAGKSTLIKLLLTLYQPDEGKILINNKNINSLNQEDKRNLFTAVFQDFVKYQLSLRENLSLSDIEARDSDAWLNKVVEMIGLHHKVEAMSSTLDSNLGKIEDNGIDLSKGEWQKICIARTLFSQTPFAILDEPTASLDPISEYNLLKNFQAMYKGRGCIIVSHRLGFASRADRILVMQEGRIVESGKHEHLILQNGIYKQMYEKQSKWYLAGDILL